METLRNDDIIKELNKGKVNKFDMIVFDDINTAKSSKSQQGQNLLKLTNAKYRIGATGTLISNTPLDCYVPMKWIGKDKSNLSTFKGYYCVYDGFANNIITGYKNIDTLKNQIEKVSLRRTKDILNLPPKTIINEYVDLNQDHLDFYNNIRDGVAEEADKIVLRTANLLAMVSRLR